MNIRIIISKILSVSGIKLNPTIIPKIQLAELLPVVDVEPVEKEGANGNITMNELTVISQLVKNNKPVAIFEIGTFNGRTTINLARFSPADAKVYTLDLPQKDIDKAKFEIEEGDRAYVDKSVIGDRYKKNSDKITQLYGDSAVFDCSPYLGKVDFVFVDGAHSDEYATSDTESAFKMLKPGGIILWHDYGVWKGVIKALNRFYRNDERFKDVRHIDGTSFVYYKKA